MNDGYVIHRSHGDYGVIEIIQDRDTRSLYFGSDAKQSSMIMSQPEKLVLSYTQAMMLALLFTNQSPSISLIGLGGGSIAKFLLHQFPDCTIDAVETRHDVVKLAHGYFKLPDEQRLKTYISDGLQFLNQDLGQSRAYDVMFIDAFDHRGACDSIKNLNFFDLCYQHLSNNGILAINLWNSKLDDFNRTINCLQTSFSGNVLLLPVKDKGNIIAFACRNATLFNKLSRYKTTAKILQDKTDIEFISLLRQLRKHNQWRKLTTLI